MGPYFMVLKNRHILYDESYFTKMIEVLNLFQFHVKLGLQGVSERPKLIYLGKF
jgi:hypothetical protein